MVPSRVQFVPACRGASRGGEHSVRLLALGGVGHEANRLA